MNKNEKLEVILQNLKQALALLDELGEVLAAAQLQMAIDTVTLKRAPSKQKPSKRNPRHNSL